MPLVHVHAHSFGKPGDTEFHYGHLCQVGDKGELIADMPEELLGVELAANRVTVIDQPKPKARKVTE